MKDIYVVTQSNELIEARHNKPLTAREQKIILTMVSGIQPNDEDFKEYRISLKNFSEMLGLKGSTKYVEIKEVVKSLLEKTIEIPKKNGGWLLSHWVSSAEYIDGEGIIELTFSPKLKPYMLQLKNQFTTYQLGNILALRSTYAIRLYELMKKWQYLGKWEYPVEELRGKLGVGENTYPRYANFKARVLSKAIEEVNKKTDIQISFKEIKKGRSVERIEFTIKYAPEKSIKLPVQMKKNEPKKQAENEDVRERLNTLAGGNYNFDQNYFSEMFQGASFIFNEDAEKELTLLIKYVNEEETIKNPLGFIKSKLKAAWKFHEDGIFISFADLQINKRTTGRTEMIPSWFGEKDDPNQEVEDPNIEEERRRLLEELNAITKNKKD